MKTKYFICIQLIIIKLINLIYIKLLKIKLEDIVGSGKDGRVLKDDIVKYLEQMSASKSIERKFLKYSRVLI